MQIKRSLRQSLAGLKRAGVEIHARSVFLQGLLLMTPERLPANLASARSQLEKFRAHADKMGLTPLQAALGFALGVPELDCVVVGVNSAAQLAEILVAVPRSVDVQWLAQFALGDPELLDPSRWPR